MTGSLPQRTVEHLRRVDFLVTAGLLAPTHIADQRLEQRPALGVPEHRARAFLLEVEQPHLASEPAMIAPFGFLEPVQIGD